MNNTNQSTETSEECKHLRTQEVVWETRNTRDKRLCVDCGEIV